MLPTVRCEDAVGELDRRIRRDRRKWGRCFKTGRGANIWPRLKMKALGTVTGTKVDGRVATDDLVKCAPFVGRVNN